MKGLDPPLRAEVTSGLGPAIKSHPTSSRARMRVSSNSNSSSRGRRIQGRCRSNSITSNSPKGRRKWRRVMDLPEDTQEDMSRLVISSIKGNTLGWSPLVVGSSYLIPLSREVRRWATGSLNDDTNTITVYYETINFFDEFAFHLGHKAGMLWDTTFFSGSQA